MIPNALFSFTQTQSLTVALGILTGLVWSRRTGWSCGGIITPGILALCISDPARILFSLLLGTALTFPLALAARTFRLYGRERVGAAMLLALAAKIGLAFLLPPGLRQTGWVVPGLIAADGERQGLGMTLCGVIACTLVTVFGMTLLKRILPGL
ncbi:MAG: poly-gamma-glutamate biosynthesis protein PgsC/CapC [Synergistaceae bacterium]|jgi:hypothetical protein|nr:poly-gamma-glutamate biosynthesis protein PgsC/CapC [Synergistaceae bacterium]